MNTVIRISIHLALMTGALVVILTRCKKEKDIPETVTDIDSNIYLTVTIGNQVWLVDNGKGNAIQRLCGLSVRCVMN